VTRLDALYRDAHAQLVASIGARLSDVSLAEDVVQEAFATAAEQWSAPPPHARAWLFRVAWNKALDRLRAARRLQEIDDEALEQLETQAMPQHDDDIADERLRLIFTCCHPSLNAEAQVALTLRSVAGLQTPDVARLFFAEPAAMAQRLVRAQRKIRDARIPWVVPGPEAYGERFAAVLAVVYLVFTQGYASPRAELCDEAIRLGRVLVELLSSEGEAHALLALMLLHDSRRAARSRDGALIPLEEQDRAQWNNEALRDGLAALDRALELGARGPYAVQASIAAVHARALKPEDTDWNEILALYDVLEHLQPTPVVSLNRAVALAMAKDPQAGLDALDGMKRLLEDNHLFHAARADLLRRLGRKGEAATAYRAAIARVTQDTERRFLERRLASLQVTS
jgi:RNA polymerase sigma-70 factor (ECF subfamily)